MIKVTIEEVPEFTFVRTDEALEVISNRTGNRYQIDEVTTWSSKNHRSYHTDMAVVILLEYCEEEDGYIYANDCIVDYIFGAEFIFAEEPDALKDVCEIIRKFEN